MLLRVQNTKRRNTCSSSKAKLKAKHRRCHRKFSLPGYQRPQHLLLLALRHQVQQARGRHPSHCGLVSCFFSVVHRLGTLMVINTSTYEQLFHLFFWIAPSSRAAGWILTTCLVHYNTQ
ncbi:hypothetical protein BDR06DRAFT_427342 [Suillus hirtellus]|nr:hypothetical protein BDR06DRAFT_427342 [Suillus hirtellus]